jgi:hypothetical protein
MLKGIGYHLELLKSKIFLPYRHSARNDEEEGRRNIEKMKSIKYKIENQMQDSLKYLY